ncbi:hypothetical protein LEP1GSC161_4256 [Leptospira santarosai str. CBC1416]|uniref:Uncharacterized protein n=1 Tax=Leptospira santarosai str. CBC1416 TaxID=1193059 RepID=M6WAI8_9LEPT|nr:MULTISPECIES: hypothetical protein [Leptospira]EMO58798.1 hypothetical protein LEP1GSC161_4256 [Leptospira santarosai str. CBC1416]EMO13520.1 hypothetical protein LEP1GSC165_1792 [Leptospira santarosai str. CBC523]MDI7219721.1 hypothetical protein [Leptospira santarosai]TQE67244.1 hypothetical protein FF021_17860 [Leptospira noguchii]UOG50311.1 hypothetical protein MAL00_08860 [Leptospira noguchii]
MLATKSIGVRFEPEDLERFERIAQKAEKTAFGAVFDTSIQNFIRRSFRIELDRLEAKVANSTKV